MLTNLITNGAQTVSQQLWGTPNSKAPTRVLSEATNSGLFTTPPRSAHVAPAAGRPPVRASPARALSPVGVLPEPVQAKRHSIYSEEDPELQSLNTRVENLEQANATLQSLHVENQTKIAELQAQNAQMQEKFEEFEAKAKAMQDSMAKMKDSMATMQAMMANHATQKPDPSPPSVAPNPAGPVTLVDTPLAGTSDMCTMDTQGPDTSATSGGASRGAFSGPKATTVRSLVPDAKKVPGDYFADSLTLSDVTLSDISSHKDSFPNSGLSVEMQEYERLTIPEFGKKMVKVFPVLRPNDEAMKRTEWNQTFVLNAVTKPDYVLGSMFPNTKATGSRSGTGGTFMFGADTTGAKFNLDKVDNFKMDGFLGNFAYGAVGRLHVAYSGVKYDGKNLMFKKLILDHVNKTWPKDLKANEWPTKVWSNKGVFINDEQSGTPTMTEKQLVKEYLLVFFLMLVGDGTAETPHSSPTTSPSEPSGQTG